MIKAILFDMDGVLIDAKEWHFESLNMALIDYGFDPITLDDHLSFFDGLPTKDKFDIYEEKYNKKISSNLRIEINKKKQEHTIKIANIRLKKDYKKIKMLKFLKKNNYKVACCSNSIKNSIMFFLKKAGLLKYMDFVLSNEDVEQGKPNPEIYLKAQEKLNLLPLEVLVFEDNENGIIAAKKSGANVSIVKHSKNLSKKYIKEILKGFESEKV